MTAPAPSNYYQISRPPDLTYVKWGAPGTGLTLTSAQLPPAMWADLPGANIPLQVGGGSPSYGACFFIATFNADAVCSDADQDAVVSVIIHFGNKMAEPSADNRFVTARGNPGWSSHTIVRTVKFDPSTTLTDATAQVKVASAGIGNGEMSFRNWLLKIERYNT